jgi:hypothetical protein
VTASAWLPVFARLAGQHRQEHGEDQQPVDGFLEQADHAAATNAAIRLSCSHGRRSRRLRYQGVATLVLPHAHHGAGLGAQARSGAVCSARARRRVASFPVQQAHFQHVVDARSTSASSNGLPTKSLAPAFSARSFWSGCAVMTRTGR